MPWLDWCSGLSYVLHQNEWTTKSTSFQSNHKNILTCIICLSAIMILHENLINSCLSDSHICQNIYQVTFWSFWKYTWILRFPKIFLCSQRFQKFPALAKFPKSFHTSRSSETPFTPLEVAYLAIVYCWSLQVCLHLLYNFLFLLFFPQSFLHPIG